MTTAYFTELSRLLTERGMPAPQVAATVADLEGYLAESGSADAHEEFGAPDVLADRLTRGRAAEPPVTGQETWRWTADIYTDRRLLNEHGAQGWEVERVDPLGRFVCRRPDAAMRWEYRRETARGAKEREAQLAGLAPDGWEPCGRWLHITYYKRPASASAGPAAALAAPPPAPARTMFFSAKFRALAAVFVVCVTLLVILFGFGLVDLDGPWACVRLLDGAVVGLALGWFGVNRDLARGTESR
ncbi:hypothetical protein ABZ734_14805 [Streptomyces sp. NPDC006660]|uniref:hypothetical protein n=1 Tax=Streptomyces sp. NPDC006660 TaxID=3156901 RepID=UPI0033D42668